jgi:hypothetical protein
MGMRFSIAGRYLEGAFKAICGFVISLQASKTGSSPEKRKCRPRPGVNHFLNDLESLGILLTLILPFGEEEPPFNLLV